MKETDCLLVIGKVFLWQDYQVRSKLWVRVQRPYAFNDIPIVHITGLTTNDNLLMLELWASWQLLVNDCVELL